jgi:hypothetical protein
VPAYILAQSAGAFACVTATDLMVGLSAFSISTHARSGPAQMFREFIATFGLLIQQLNTVCVPHFFPRFVRERVGRNVALL